MNESVDDKTSPDLRLISGLCDTVEAVWDKIARRVSSESKFIGTGETQSSVGNLQKGVVSSRYKSGEFYFPFKNENMLDAVLNDKKIGAGLYFKEKVLEEQPLTDIPFMGYYITKKDASKDDRGITLFPVTITIFTNDPENKNKMYFIRWKDA